MVKYIKYTQSSCFLIILAIFVISAYVQCTSCRQYKFGSTSKLHYYPCCRNPNKDCDGKTYHGGGSKEPTEDYCDPGGVATGGGVSWILFSAVVLVVSRIIIVRRNVKMHGLGCSK